MLVLKLKTIDNEGIFDVTYPSDHYVRTDGRGWIRVYNAEEREKAAYSDKHVYGHFYRDDPKVPVDTRLNYTMMKRASNGRFVGKK